MQVAMMKKPMTRTRRMYNKGGAVGGVKPPEKMSAGRKVKMSKKSDDEITQSMTYGSGGKLKMVKNKQGEEVPFFLADEEGKSMGGTIPGPKGYFKGGKVL